MSQFLMPSLGADMEAGTLVEQLAAAGDEVKRGDVIAAVETQKGTIEIEVFEDGVLENWLVDLGSRVPVGTPLAMIRSDGQAGETISAAQPKQTPKSKEPRVPPKPVKTPEPRPKPEPKTQSPSKTRIRATPAARRLAARSGIDLSRVPPGEDAVISRADITSLSSLPTAPKQSDMRAAIAAAMSRSKQEIPHYYLSHQIDLTKADDFVLAYNADRPPEDRLLLGALHLKAISAALRKYKEFNGHFVDGVFQQSDEIHIGLAINLRGGGLVAPALFDVDDQSLSDLMLGMRDLVSRVRAGRFKARELAEATITLSSLGDRGVDRLYGVIYPPQVAIVGMGTPRTRPAIFEGQIVPRLMTTLTLAADHRVSDGHRGALFLRAIDKHLQTPEAL